MIGANAFLESYYKGDGCLLPSGLRKFTTVSQNLKNDLLSLLGGIGQYCSIWHPPSSDECYRITETEGKKYKRKFMRLLNFNSTTPVKVKSVKIIKEKQEIFNLEMENGWFVSTNGILVHDSNNKFLENQN